MSLSSLIVQREIATIREVEEALARQVLYGGDLVTNLLEVARLAEESVTPLLAESYGLPVGPIGELPQASSDAKRLVPAEMAARRSMYPLTIESGKLVVVVPNPLDRDAEKELSFALELPVEQRIAPAVRVRQAIAREYGIPLERRLQRLLQRMAGSGDLSSSMPPLLKGTPQVPEAPKPPPPSRTGFSDEPPKAMPARSGAKVVAPAPERPVSEPAPKTLIQRHSQAPRPQRRRRGPLPFDAAKKELEEATERDAVLDLFFDFARQFFDYSAFFVVHHDTAEGRDAFGDGASRDRVAGIQVPLDGPSLLKKARDYGEATVIAPATEGLDAVLWTDLQLTKKTPVLLVPLVVRRRVVGLLLGHTGDLAIDETAKKEVVSFSRAVGAAFERIIVAKKRAAAPPPRDTTKMSAPPPIDTEKTPAVAYRPDPTLPETLPKASKAPPPTQASPTLSSREATTAPDPGARRAAEAAAIAVALVNEPRLSETSDAPPPPTVAAVRRPRGAPIPREEPPDLRPRSDAPRRDAEPPARRSSKPPPDAAEAVELRSGSQDPRAEPSEPPTRRHGRGALSPDELGRKPTSDAPERAPTLEERHVEDDEARALLAEIDDGWRGPRSQRRPPSDQAISVPAHSPPSKRSRPPEQLPSVIVDVEEEVATLVERFVNDPSDEQAEAELLRLGQAAMPAIMARFPGPLDVPPSRLGDPLPRVTACGPVLRLIARQRRVALPFVLSHIDSNDPETRMWATFLLSELAYPEAVEPLVARVFDTSPRVRKVARVAARAVAEVAVAAIVERLGKVALQSEAAPGDRIVAIETLGELREPLAVPVLIGALGDQNADIGVASRAALMLIARQDFGVDARKWNAWFSANATKHRIEWLIDALDHEISGMRKAAGIELRSLTKEFYGYSEDLPKRERERAQQRYREWWSTDGRMRFRRM
jgi:hypothetical protein